MALVFVFWVGKLFLSVCSPRVRQLGGAVLKLL